MKNLSLVLMLIFCVPPSYSQDMVGYDKEDIFEILGEDSVEVTLTDKGTESVVYRGAHEIYYHYLNESEVCYVSIMIPRSNTTNKYYIDHFNENFVVVSDSTWKDYRQGIVISIDLRYIKEDNMYVWVFGEKE